MKIHTKRRGSLKFHCFSIDSLKGAIQTFLDTWTDNAAHAEVLKEFEDAQVFFKADIEIFKEDIVREQSAWETQKTTNGALRKAINHFEEALLEIHVELEDLNAEAVKLVAIIKRNFEELGI